jgi:Amt family ammonium transporter
MRWLLPRGFGRTVAGAIVTLFAMSSMADVIDSGDTAWILTSTALVLFMTVPGLSLFYAGLVRSRNVLSVLMQCFTITCLVTILWLVLLYSLAFGEGNAFIGGLSKVFFNGVVEGSVRGSIPESAFAMFQLTFAIITPALIVGGFAERMRFSSLLIFTTLWMIAVYAPVCHWVWGGGWLGPDGVGVMDFAGGTVVHITAGTAALVAAIVMGPRRGFPGHMMPPHNMTLTVTGAGMLWVGWFGFNGGSALTSGGDAAMAIAVTHISAAAGALTWMTAEWLRFGKPSALGAVTGMVAGLATITPASGYVGPAGALIMGISGGYICWIATNFMKRTLKVDDSLDVFPVHAVGAVVGMLLTAVFASNAIGIFSGQGNISGMGSQFGKQVIGVVVTFSYTAVVSYVILRIVDVMTGNRVTVEQETEGLDLVLHNERGYDL